MQASVQTQRPGRRNGFLLAVASEGGSQIRDFSPFYLFAEDNPSVQGDLKSCSAGGCFGVKQPWLG